MKKTFLFLSLLLLVLTNSFSQETPRPEFFGTYVVIRGQLIEFNKNNAADISAVGDLVNPTLGIRKLLGPWLTDPNLYFITYGEKTKPILTSLEWKSTVNSKNSITGTYKTIEANMYVPGDNIEFKIAPVQGLEDCYKYIPSTNLNEGYYCLHFGRLTSQDARDGNPESNAKKNVFDFAFTKGFMMKGDLSKCDIDNGEFIMPNTYGLHFIENKKYITVPFSKNKDVIEYDNGGNRNEGLLNPSSITLDASNLEKSFISFSEENIRKGIKISISTAKHKDMIPEKMFLSKLKQIEVDTRSKREIKKSEPEKIMKIWIEDIEIPFRFDLSGFYYPLIARLYTEKSLEPGVYAFHNGALKGKTVTFGLSNVIYSFTVK